MGHDPIGGCEPRLGEGASGAAQRRSRTAGDSAHGADGLAVRVRGGRRGDTVRPGEVTVEHIRVLRGAARGRHLLGLRYV